MSHKHQVVKRIVSRRGVRTDYKIVVNGRELKGRYVTTMVKGEKVSRTEFKNQSVPYYNPKWLLARNGVTNINLEGHPCMREAEEAEAIKEAA